MPSSTPCRSASPAETRPRSPEVHLLRTESGGHAFVVDGSRLFDLDKAAFAQLSAALDGEAIGSVLDDFGLDPPRRASTTRRLSRMPVRALVAGDRPEVQSRLHLLLCAGGRFRGRAKEHAAGNGARLGRSAAGGNQRRRSASTWPFSAASRWSTATVLRRTAEYARDRAAARGQAIGFSITTNGTVVDAGGRRFLRGFRLRRHCQSRRSARRRMTGSGPSRAARGSFDIIVHRLEPLLARQRRDAGYGAGHRHALQSRPAADARRTARAGLLQRRFLADAGIAHRLRRNGRRQVSKPCWTA